MWWLDDATGIVEVARTSGGRVAVLRLRALKSDDTDDPDGSAEVESSNETMVTTGLTVVAARLPPAMCKGPVLQRSDWLGTDILPSDKPLYTADAAECCQACANHTTSGTAPCLYWSRNSKPQGRCYLKTTATNRHGNPGMECGSLPGAPPMPGPKPPHPPGPPAPPAPPQYLSLNLSAPPRPFNKPFLECVGSSHMAMGLLSANNASGPSTAAGKGEQSRVGSLWREHLQLVRRELNMSHFRGHGM